MFYISYFVTNENNIAAEHVQWDQSSHLPQLNINKLIPNQAMFQETKIKEMKATLDDDNNLFSAAL